MRAAGLMLAAAMLGQGCSAFKPRPADPGLSLLAPSEAGLEISLSQSLKFTKGGKSFEALAAVEVEKGKLSLAGLGPLGNRMLFVSWDGERLESERDPSLPEELPLGLLLRDLQLAYWPAEAWAKALPKGWELRDSGNERVFLKGGEPALRLRYGGADRWRSSLSFEHLGLGYSLDIQPIEDGE